MKLTINEKKALYAFGCKSRRTTVRRLHLIAEITPEPATAALLHRVAGKLEAENSDKWYRHFFRTLHDEIAEYNQAETVMHLAQTTSAGLEDYLDEAEQG